MAGRRDPGDVVKVLAEGTGQKGWAGEFTCTGAGNGGGGCGARLLVEQADLFHTHRYDYGGGHDIFTTFQCPQCSRLNDIKHPSGIGSIPETYKDWVERKQAIAAAQATRWGDPIEEARQKSQPTYPGRF